MGKSVGSEAVRQKTGMGAGRGGKDVQIEPDRGNCYDADTKKR